jgi:hypothetical protein
MKNYKPQTLYEFSIEIKVYEKYLKKYEKLAIDLKSKNIYWKDRNKSMELIRKTKHKLQYLYPTYLKLLNKSNKPKLTIIYQSKMNKY